MHHTAVRLPKFSPAGPAFDPMTCHLTHDAAHHQRNAAETRRRQMGTPDPFADTAAAALPEPGD